MIKLCDGDLLRERPDGKIEVGSIHFSNGPLTCRFTALPTLRFVPLSYTAVY